MPNRVLNLKVDKDDAKCHLMPCLIEHNQQNVKAREYFWPTIKVLKAGGDEEQGREENRISQIDDANPNNPILTASFRGRPLQGRSVALPNNYKGVVVNPSGKTTEDNCEKSFNEFTYWNWDEIPSNEDTVIKALQWIQISKAIHGDV